MIFCITNRHLCTDFLAQIKCIAKAKPDAIFLREKDLAPADYHALVRQVAPIVATYQVPLITYPVGDMPWHHLDCAQVPQRLHLPYATFETMLRRNQALPANTIYGVSIHTTQQALTAMQAGAHYLIVGHIFNTNCKKGLCGRGVSFLQDVVAVMGIPPTKKISAVQALSHLPLYAIGGITPANAGTVIEAGASGICVMSTFMQSENPTALMKKYTNQLQLAHASQK